ncbi:hypothetical protein A2917_01380 [Candidatus Nomurabacteria bacterium RIFCSPLOWO2_01_FULL_42_17]|uniref:Methyltransferase type 11 domain-containing protein n=1 Tax=Candidatus Nomurabacteria bacterium RIFCSPLOWO2_01_FULL_42_17 TaxID=1801780 RepID=A0A1F6XLK2_9BACT|nr:MAG: hypothetical protein A2917_01380 [Candidatus Nomurabacteria bacterium RIFCSPLOWO2_01_FULL_42_17]
MNKNNSGEYWDSRLTQSPENPFPLAPKDWIEKVMAKWKSGNDAERGKYERKYRKENRRFGNFCRKKMLVELKNMDPGRINVLGLGLRRDIAWTEMAVRMGFGVSIWDMSRFACENARRELMILMNITQVEIMAGWKSGEIDEQDAVAYYACQFIEHQGDELPMFMHHLGEFLRVPGRKVYLILPRLEDNPSNKVKWNSASPPLDHQWQKPLLEGFGGQLNIYVLGKHKYFNRMYTFVRISM